MPREQVLAEYHRLLAGAEALYGEKVEHVEHLLESTVQLDTPSDELDRALAWSVVNLDEQVVCNPDLGCGLVAGWRPSGTGTRPGFGWFFGGDAAINSLAMDVLGMAGSVAQGLRFLASYQREDGKMPHEISQAAAHVPWFTDFPYPYYHADTTPYWIVAVWNYWLATGDDAFVDEHWQALERAYRWGLGRDTDGDGIIENGPGNLGAIEVGALGEDIHQDIYLAGVWIEALEAVADLARSRGDEALAREADAMYARAHTTLNQRYWREEEGHHAFGILTSGTTNDNLTVWPATALSFGLLNAPQARRTLRKLASDSISTEWGAHILSTASPLYDPMHYNNGAVWPFVTGFVAWAQYNYGRPWSAYPLVSGLQQLTFDFARGRHPELLSGTYYRPLDAAVPQQFFATSMLVSPVLRGLIGWSPDAPRGRARIAPQLPPSWDRVEVKGLPVGPVAVDALIRSGPGRRSVALTASGGEVEVDVAMVLPPGGEGASFVVDGRPWAGAVALDTLTGQLVVTVPVGADPTDVALTWQGGLEVEAPAPDLEPGQRSGGLRVLDFEWDGAGWTADVEGPGGTTHDLRFHGTEVTRVEGAELAGRVPGVTTVRIAFPDEAPRVTHRIRLHP